MFSLYVCSSERSCEYNSLKFEINRSNRRFDWLTRRVYFDLSLTHFAKRKTHLLSLKPHFYTFQLNHRLNRNALFLSRPMHQLKFCSIFIIGRYSLSFLVGFCAKWKDTHFVSSKEFFKSTHFSINFVKLFERI